MTHSPSGGPAWTEDSWRSKILQRELVIQVESVARLADDLQDNADFATDTPSILCKLIGCTASLIAKYLPQTPPHKLRDVNELCNTLSAHLRYAERSVIGLTPWSMIQPAEIFMTARAGANCRFIIRPKWGFNYAIFGEFVGNYHAMIKNLEWIPTKEWLDEIDDTINLEIYAVSFPRIGRLNCLYHVNWGHEVGHILARRWLKSNFPPLWREKQTKIAKALTEHVKANPPPVTSDILDDFIKQTVFDSLKTTMSLFRHGLEELLCDAVAVHLFGPAALAAACEFSARYYPDINPLGQSEYPPWRYRLRHMLDACENDLERCEEALDGDKKSLADRLTPYVTWLRDTNRFVESDDDQQAVDRHILTKLAYDLIETVWADARDDVLRSLPEDVSAPYQLCDRLDTIEELVGKLDANIPPNEVGSWPETQPSLFEDILNAGWAFKMKVATSGEDWGKSDDHARLYRLLLKSLEASFVHEHFNAKSPEKQRQ